VRRLVAALLFLVVVNEGDPSTLYSKPAPRGLAANPFAPFDWVQSVLLDPLPFKVRPFDLIVLGILLAASFRTSKKSRSVAPMRNALFLSLGTVVLWFAYGVATGGDSRAASWQIYLLLSAILFAFTVGKTFVVPEHYELLAKTIIVAGLYRAIRCWYFNFAYVSVGLVEMPEYLTAHDDSVIWVVSILAILVYALNKRRVGTTIRAVLLNVFFLGAIQWNMRRLAWVSLVMGLVTAFFLLPRGKVRDRVLRTTWIAAPIIALYVIIGWGRTERIFAPLQSIASVSTQEDRSTKARNAENLGLIATIGQSNAVTGTGWGHPYVELTNKYSIAAAMELWPFVPHNSVLGLLAYTGILGFAGYWLAFPTAVFLNARLAKMGKTEQVRNAGFVCSTAMIVCGNQMYGDMGIFSLRTMYVLATTYAVAMKLPIVSGVWQAPAGAPASPPRVGIAGEEPGG
jgi:hypothetical protein